MYAAATTSSNVFQSNYSWPTSTCTLPSSFHIESCPPISRLASFCMGNGSLTSKTCLQKQNRNNSDCNIIIQQIPPRNACCNIGKTCAGPGCFQRCAPPAFIGNGKPLSLEERLRNIDVYEECRYYPREEEACCPAPVAPYCCDYYNMYNNCYGGMECGPCVPNCCPKKPEEVKFSRRQVFNFGEDGGGATSRKYNYECTNGDDNCNNGKKNNNSCRCQCQRTNSFDEIPVGKNPVAKLRPCDCRCCQKANETLDENCESKLPKTSGVYYFNKSEGRFEKQEEQIIDIVDEPPVVEVPPEPIIIRREPEVIIQPIYQPMYSNNNNNCCQQPCCWNPSMGMGALFGMNSCNNNNLLTGNVVPMCIPYCGGGGGNFAAAPGPYPYPPNYPTFDGSSEGSKKKKKRKMKKEKQRSSVATIEKGQDTIFNEMIDQMEEENERDPITTITTVTNTNVTTTDVGSGEPTTSKQVESRDSIPESDSSD